MSFRRFYTNNGNNINIILTTITIVIFALGFYFQHLNDLNASPSNKIQKEVAGIQEKSVVTPTIEIKKEFFVNPLTGLEITPQEYLQIKERNIFAVVISNEVNSRPQYGINEADIVYEIPSEGGITRLLGIYWSEAPNKVMSVRSARKYFVDILGDFGSPVFMHVGAAEGGISTNALTAINQQKVRSVANEPNSYDRDSICQKNKAIEHCAFVDLTNLDRIAKRNHFETSINNINLYSYSENKIEREFEVSNNISYTSEIEVDFGTNQNIYRSKWIYDEQNKKYTKFYFSNLEEPSKDAYNQDITTDVLIVQDVEIYSSGDEKNRLIIDIIGSGNASIYQKGTKTEVLWEKQTFSSPTKFTNIDGSPFIFDRGKKWIAIQ